MSKGGARPGAGRPSGGTVSRTQELIAKAREQGISPIEVLLKSMRYYDDLSDQAVIQFHGAQSAKEKAKLLKVVTSFKSSARDYAVSAAPYIHPKLNSISAPNGGPIQLNLQVEFVNQ